MLNEAILKFKGLAPLILPELVNNNQLEEVSMYEDYAILPYSVQKPLPLEEVMDMFEDKMEMIILYHMVPSEQTNFGHTCCAYSNPSTERMFKVNVTTNGSGEVDSLLVTIYDSLEIMSTDLIQDLRLNEKRGAFKYKRDQAEMLNDFNL